MRVLLGIIIVGFLIIICAENGLADDFDFRKTKWGMSVAQVKASEPLAVSKEQDNILMYKTQVIGKDVLLVYIFVDNQLVRAKYILAESHTNRNDYITDYNDFKEIVTKKYGKPSADKTVWKSDLYKDDYKDWGLAVSLGHLIYLSSWKTQNTEIYVLLHGENYDITCGVEYSSKDLEELENKAKEKEALDAF